MTKFPMEFLQRMHHLLGDEYNDFLEALHEPAWRGVRLHRCTVNGNIQTSDASQPFWSSYTKLPLPRDIVSQLGEPVPWFSSGYYIPANSTLGKSIYHAAGAFYLQEPSAMAAVAALNPQPGETILDLCAAPGGKTTAIAERMNGQGALVANEIHPTRVLALAQNIERLGVFALITNESPNRLLQAFPNRFDAVLVDAPCSGEGMFRKDAVAREEWTPEAPGQCATRQQDVLSAAVGMVREGGRIVYSTCTFNPEENEQLMSWAVRNLPVQLMPLPDWPGWRPANPDWADGNPDLQHARRLWPHIGRGEGHFVALLQVTENANRPAMVTSMSSKAEKKIKGVKKQRQAGMSHSWTELASDVLQQSFPESHPDHAWVVQKETVFLTHAALQPMHPIRLLRPGIAMFEQQRDRWTVHHNLATVLYPLWFHSRIDLPIEDATHYLSGESLAIPAAKSGLQLVCVQGLAIGWGKSVPGRINNLYPKGLRRTNWET